MRVKLNHAICVLVVSLSLIALSCKKEINEPSIKDDAVSAMAGKSSNGHLKQTKTFSSDVVTRWVDMQLDMLRSPFPVGTGSAAPERAQAYCGIALYEAVVNGMPAYRSLSGQLTDFPAMPQTEPGKAYHWAASANAALAEMNRRLFTTTSSANRAAMDNLESSLQGTYATEVDDVTLQRSIDFGKEVVDRVFTWAAADGSANINDPYNPQVGPGLWIPTAPIPPINPYSFQRRLLVPGVAVAGAIEPPPAYSANAASPFFAMVKDVYDKSQALTQAQIDLALYYRDAGGLPGYPGGGHYVAIFSQVLKKAAPQLDIAAVAYAKSGLGFSDAGILCFNHKYSFKLLRPITYIRNEMGFGSWSPLFGTPNHPEFPSAHSSNAGGFLTMLSDVFGENFQLTETTYAYMGLADRTYNSFSEMRQAIGNSRVYAGIHYQASCDKGNAMGAAVSQYILNKIKFLK